MDSPERRAAEAYQRTQELEAQQQRSYDGLTAARRHIGMGRIVMGVHLVRMFDDGSWRGRTGAMSFRRFLLEEGIEPKAAHQYMTVARTFVLQHGVTPQEIALVGMRVLVDASRFLRDEGESNALDIVAIVTSMASAEAHEALVERFGPTEVATSPERLDKPVYKILDSVDTLTHEQRATLYQRLRAGEVPERRQPSGNDISATTRA